MYEKITLPNGVRIIYEHIPHVRSAALGIWIGTGSRHEKAPQSGVSHFIEHMLFKGTNTRTAAELADLMDSIGGRTNAFTTKECTCYYGHVLDTHLELLSEVLCDMLFNSKFDEADITNERGVIFEEIDMYNDSPDDLVAERLSASIFKGSSLARPILGKKSTLENMTGESLKDYLSANYFAGNIVIALSGSFSQSDVTRLSEFFSNTPSGKKNKLTAVKYTPSFIAKRKSIEQNHLCLGFPGLSVSDGDRYACQLMSSILGGGMSSRLFRKVREERGLCYSVYSYSSSYIDTGVFNIYTALGKDSEQEALSVITDEIKKFKDKGVTSDELDRAREQVKANVLMGLESTGSRMNRLGRSELFLGSVTDTDELIAEYDKVTAEDLRVLAGRYLDFSKMSFSAVGRTDSAEQYRELIYGLTSA